MCRWLDGATFWKWFLSWQKRMSVKMCLCSYILANLVCRMHMKSPRLWLRLLQWKVISTCCISVDIHAKFECFIIRYALFYFCLPHLCYTPKYWSWLGFLIPNGLVMLWGLWMVDPWHKVLFLPYSPWMELILTFLLFLIPPCSSWSL